MLDLLFGEGTFASIAML